jgi:hypothetical protein
VPRVGVTGSFEKIEALAEPGEKSLRCEELGTRGSELERERKPVETGTEGADGVVLLEVGTDRPGASDEERHGLALGEGWQVELGLTLDAEGFPTRHNESQSGRGLNELGELARRVRKQVLEVVHEDVGALLAHARGDRAHLGRGRAQPLRDRRQHEIGLPHWCECAENRATVRVLGEQAAELQGKARLARAAGPEHAEYPRVALVHDGNRIEELLLSAEKVGRRGRKLDRAWRPKRRELFEPELEEPNRSVEVLEPVRSEVAELLAVEERCGHG